MKVLQGDVGEIRKELEELKEQWNEFRKPIADEIAAGKQEASDKKVEYKYKLEKIKDIKKDVKQALEELDHKKQLLVYLTDQFEKLPKDINRNQYLKRIHEIIGNLKRQKADIKQILEEIRGI
jgi:coiled-coil domain-containing protein 22